MTYFRFQDKNRCEMRIWKKYCRQISIKCDYKVTTLRQNRHEAIAVDRYLGSYYNIIFEVSNEEYKL